MLFLRETGIFDEQMFELVCILRVLGQPWNIERIFQATTEMLIHVSVNVLINHSPSYWSHTDHGPGTDHEEQHMLYSLRKKFLSIDILFNYIIELMSKQEYLYYIL